MAGPAAQRLETKADADLARARSGSADRLPQRSLYGAAQGTAGAVPGNRASARRGRAVQRAPALPGAAAASRSRYGPAGQPVPRTGPDSHWGDDPGGADRGGARQRPMPVPVE